MMKKQSGAALFIALILLAILMVIGVASVRNSTFQEKMSVNVHQLNWAKNASDSGVASLVNLANSSATSASENVLNRARLSGSLEYCVDANGNESDVVVDGDGNASCDTYVDGDDALTSVRVIVEPAGCNPGVCFGVSQGEGNNRVNCQAYTVRSIADAAGVSDTVEWWGQHYTASCQK